MKTRILIPVLFLLTCFLFPSLSLSQYIPVPIPPPVTGMERISPMENSGDLASIRSRRTFFEPQTIDNTIQLEYTTLPIYTNYDLISNGVPSNIFQVQNSWQEYSVHASVMYVTDPGFTTVKSAYFFTNDNGVNWQYLGDVPYFDAGFPALTVLPNGAAVVANQIYSSGNPVRTIISYDQGIGFGVFATIEPPNPNLLWPRLTSTTSGKIVFGTSMKTTHEYIPRAFTKASTNVVTNLAPPGQFSGNLPYEGNGAEGYSFSTASDGRIGHAYIGYDADEPFDVFYRSSSNEGLSWSQPEKIWDWDIATNPLGCIRGVSMVFGSNNQPYIAFNTSKITGNGFFPGLSSQIRVWSPAMNNGVALKIADSTNVPFYPNTGNVNDAFLPLCRPAIGRATGVPYPLFVVFNATTERTGSDSSRFYSVWMVPLIPPGSVLPPIRLTPAEPLRDWRFPSISPISKTYGFTTIVQMLCLADSVAGTHVTGSPAGRAEYVSIRCHYPIIWDSIRKAESKEGQLHQNHPNPFNPTTSITFELNFDSRITLTITNVLGREVMRLVNGELKPAGSHTYHIDASQLASGIYFCRFETEEAVLSRKMVLIR